MKIKKYYTVYKDSDDSVIAFGNAEECAAMLGLKDRRQFQAFVSKTRSGLRRKYKVVVEEYVVLSERTENQREDQ